MLKRKGTGFFSDFKAFIARGNVINLAVAIIIGAAFTAIINSLVGDIIMPIIGSLLGDSDFSSLVWVVNDTLTIGYGNFIKAVIDFLLIALLIFTIIRVFTKAERRMRKALEKKSEAAQNEPAQEPAAPVETADDILRDIRELLKAQKTK